jgi:hypothetical protein
LKINKTYIKILNIKKFGVGIIWHASKIPFHRGQNFYRIGAPGVMPGC